MRFFKKTCKFFSFFTALCMIVAMFPLSASAAITYQQLCTGSDALSLSSANEKATLTKDISGFGGKKADDTVYRYQATSSGSGTNYINLSKSLLTGSVIEFNLLLNSSSSVLYFIGGFINQTGYDNYLVNGKVSTSSGNYTSIEEFIRFNTSGVTIDPGKKTAVDESVQGKTVAEAFEPGVWHTVAIKTPGLANNDGESDFLLYVDGQEFTLPFSEKYYGTRHMRLYGKGDMYIDNLMVYESTQLASGSDYKNYSNVPVLTSSSDDITISGERIILNADVTPAQLGGMLSGADTIRVYTDETYTTLADDNAVIMPSHKIVAALKNNSGFERGYSYYTASEMVYEEPGILDGTNDLTVTVGTDNTKPATVSKAYGVFGKASNDPSYKIELNYGHSGRNYIGANPQTRQSVVWEFSFANSDNPPEMFTNVNMYTDATSTASETRIAHSFFELKYNAVYVGTGSNIVSSARGIKLCDAKPGQWVNLALVLPGPEESGENGASTVYIYANGIKYDIPLEKPVYGVRHIRLHPDTTYEDMKTLYIDNYRLYYGSEPYDPAKDAKPVVDLTNVDAYEDNINVEAGTTVADFKSTLDSKTVVRVFEDDTYQKQLEDADEMGAGNVVVFAANNKRTTERTYSYYTVNSAISAKYVRLVNESGKYIKGSQEDLEKAGETYYLETIVTNKSTSDYTGLVAMAASYDENGKMLKASIKPITLEPGENTFAPGKNEITFEGLETPKNGTLKAFLWYAGSIEPLCPEFLVEFNGMEEYHVIAFSNSYGNDAFTNLPEVAKAAGVDIYAVNMYTSGCTLQQHYWYMNGNGKYEKRIEYTPYETITTEDVGFTDGLYTEGYLWDYITIQQGPRAYNFDDFYTPEAPYITALADYIRANSPSSEVMVYQTWVRDTDTAKTNSATKDLVAGLEDSEIRPTLFAMIKENYSKTAEMIGNPNRIVPVGEAINYAVGTLGFPERVLKNNGSYDSSGESRGMYRDTTCHLATCGKILNSLTWYEYITGRDARENPYQHSNISNEDMTLLKEAAHWACSQTDYIPQN